uniref:Uncharacterized protein n=1 Tax=Heliothis virescens TaxID=7102 RepID=A0A2A4J1W0_HELVI
MSEVRACLYFSVILLCFQISVAKPFFGTRFWCDVFCDDDDNVSTSTTTASSEDYLDAFCADCPPTRRPRPPTTRMPPIPANVWMPGGPGMPVGPGNQGPVNYFVIPPQSGANFSMAPNANNGLWNFVFSPYNPAGPGGPPSATPAPAPAPAPSATTAAPGATPAATTAAATTAAPAARK